MLSQGYRRRRALMAQRPNVIAGSMPQGPLPNQPAPYTESQATSAFDASAQQAGQVGAQGVQLGYERTRDFNPESSLRTYAQGAWDDMVNSSGGLKDTLRDVEGRAVGAGRYRTGFLDEDQGAVIRGATRDFGNQVAMQSMNATALMQRNNAALYGIGAEQQGVQMDALASRREEMINDRRERDSRRRQRKRGIGGAIGGVLGGVGGFLIGGPAGAAAGYKIGSGIGGAVTS